MIKHSALSVHPVLTLSMPPGLTNLVLMVVSSIPWLLKHSTHCVVDRRSNTEPSLCHFTSHHIAQLMHMYIRIPSTSTAPVSPLPTLVFFVYCIHYNRPHVALHITSASPHVPLICSYFSLLDSCYPFPHE